MVSRARQSVLTDISRVAGKFIFRRLRRTLPLLIIVLFALAMFLPVRSALAHASLLRSEPAQGSVLAAPPEEIVLEFTEALDPSFTTVELRDINSAVIVQGPGEIDADDDLILRLAIPSDLPDGTYVAVWRARSLVDGHVTVGSVGFSVGEFSERASLLPPPGTPDPATDRPLPLDTVTRALSYLAILLALGPVGFTYLVLEDAGSRVPLKRISQIGVALGVVATIAFVAVQSAQAADAASFDAFMRFWGTRSGSLLAMRIVLLIALLFAPDSPQQQLGQWARLFLGGAILMTFSLQSHTAALNRPELIALDWLHLVAMVTWVGGLLPFLIVARTSAVPLDVMTRRFSLIAVISVLVLAVTGAARAYLHAGSMEAITGTTYGQSLLVKVGLVGLMLGLGAVNLLLISPRLRAASQSAGRRLLQTVPTEITIATGVLILTGIMAGIAPGTIALEARESEGFVRSVEQDDVQMLIRMAPVQTGENEFRVEVEDTRSGAADVLAEVVLRFEALGQEMGQTQVELEEAGTDRYRARGTYITVAGTWRITVIMRKRGYDDIQAAFDIPIGDAPSTADTLINPIPPDSDSIAEGETLYAENCAACHGDTGKGDGLVGMTLNPAPADLTIHTVPGVHSDGKLWNWISDGYPGSVMPAFSQFLTEEEMWHLVNYIRTLSPEE
jgi:copper transport protein